MDSVYWKSDFLEAPRQLLAFPTNATQADLLTMTRKTVVYAPSLTQLNVFTFECNPIFDYPGVPPRIVSIMVA